MMAARLGDILYLIGCRLSVLWMLFFVLALLVHPFPDHLDIWVLFAASWLVPPGLFWIGGIACVYVLRGDTQVGTLPALAPSRIAPIVAMLFICLVAVVIVAGAFVRGDPVFNLMQLFFLLCGLCSLFLTVIAMRELIWGEKDDPILGATYRRQSGLCSSCSVAYSGPRRHGFWFPW